MLITKSDFLNYLQCPEYFWFTMHKPEVLPVQEIDPFIQQLIEQGNEVEVKARELFPFGKLVKSYGEQSIETTIQMMEENVDAIFQASFQFENLYVRIDVLELTPNGWVIYEVKSTSSENKKRDPKLQEHLYDAAFQAYVFQSLGLPLAAVKLVELNKEFVKHGEIDAEDLLTITDISDDVAQLQDNVERAVEHMTQLISDDTEPNHCGCIRFSKRNWCPAVPVLNPDLPDYTVHQLARIRTSKLTDFRNMDVVDVADVPASYKLTEIQRNQVNVYQTGEPIINSNGIRRELSQLEYPLYFLDYETFPAAIPAYDGCSPYNQVPFQFSLHILREPDGEYEHVEYLHTDKTSPIKPLTQALCESIGEKGAVIAWHMSFEVGRNCFLAEQCPEFATRIASINERMFDLEKIFTKQHYVDAEFRGSTSIKKVLPVLCPELNYDTLAIGNGGLATSKFREMAFGGIDESEKEQIANHLLEYCKLDTWAMVRIWEELKAVC